MHRVCLLCLLLCRVAVSVGDEKSPVINNDADTGGALLVRLPQVMPAPQENPTTAEKVELGKQLFFDPRLSGNNTISCATCHAPEHGYGDGVALNRGMRGNRLERNSQTCLNVGLLKKLFWDGRASSLEQQALMPIEAPEEMNQNLDELERELAAVPGYVRAFQQVFGSPPNRAGIARALAAYQRTLVSGPSPFDRYLKGEKSALSEDARQGLELFEGEAGCIQCHHGPLLTDNEFYRLGTSLKDIGRAKITGNVDDRYRFRTPGLRNIAETAPYMHDGSLKTLDDVVTFYYRGIPATAAEGLPTDTDALSDRSFSEIPLLVAFLESLTGTPPKLVPPLLPGILKSQPKTAISPAVTDDDGFLLHTVLSLLQSKPTDIRVLLPGNLNPDKKYPVVYVLPVEGGRGQRYGDGLREVKQKNLHNKHQAIFVAPSFSELPWYADHPDNPRIQQERYFLEVVIPWIEQTYPVGKSADQRLLLGFSKSGWGAWTLLLRNPKQFARSAAWDAPMMMQQFGRYGNRPIFATQKNFEKYRVTDLLKSNAEKLRGKPPRLILTGMGNFQGEHEQVHTLLEELKIPHVYTDDPRRKHDWHSGWVTEAVELLLKPED